jgi:dihydrodipicolinate synthase/N-acetylneuraminate lyase
LKRLEGMITALFPAFDAEGEVDEEGLRELVDFRVDSGVDGLFVCGTAGLGALMRPAQRETVFEVDAGDPRAPLRGMTEEKVEALREGFEKLGVL